MAPTPAPDPFEETYSFIGYGYTLTYVHSYPDYNTYDPYNGYDYGYFDNVRKTAFAVWAVAVGVIFGLQALALIVVAIVYFQRQKKRTAWYGRMAAHYRNGGLPPWAMATGGVKAPLQPNNYNANSGISYPPIAYSNPKAQHENPTQFGVYGNVPPSNTQTMGLYSNATGMTGYTGASYHTANTVSSIPPLQSSSPQPQAIGHSQYMSMTSSYEPYGAQQTMYNPNPTLYAPPPTAPTPTPYSGSGGAFGTNEYRKDKGWEYTAPPVGSPTKQ